MTDTNKNLFVEYQKALQRVEKNRERLNVSLQQLKDTENEMTALFAEFQADGVAVKDLDVLKGQNNNQNTNK